MNHLIVGDDSLIQIRLLQNEQYLQVDASVSGQMVGLRTGELLIPRFAFSRSMGDPEVWEASLPKQMVMFNMLRDYGNPHSDLVQEVSPLRKLVKMEVVVGSPFGQVLEEMVKVVRIY